MYNGISFMDLKSLELESFQCEILTLTGMQKQPNELYTTIKRIHPDKFHILHTAPPLKSHPVGNLGDCRRPECLLKRGDEFKPRI